MSDRVAELRWRERCNRYSGEQIQIGTSREGRAIHGYRFRNLSSGNSNASSHPPPVIFLISLVHPMEWIGREAHLELLDHLLAKPGPWEILSLPNANPDGTARVEASLRRGRPTWVRGNAAGVDLNRNFPVSFRRRSRLIDWWPMWRPGPGPASEPETQAVLEFVRGYSLQLSLSFHSFGRWFFYPPGGIHSADSRTTRHGQLIESALLEGNPLAYRNALLGAWSWWFRAYGIEIDTLQERHGGWTFLLELGRSSFARWGIRKLLQPFFVFNPQNPRAEIEGVLPILLHLSQAAISTPLENGE